MPYICDIIFTYLLIIMKNKSVILLLFLAICGLTEAKAVANDEGANTSNFIYRGTGNPYLPLWEHLPDGEPRVFEDPDNPGKYRAYIIGSHDVRFKSYCGADIRMWSAPVEDLSAWRDEGPIFTYQIGGKWDVMYAPDLVEVRRKDGKKEYYLYPHSRGRHREAMVAKGERPDGPFTPINLTADGTKTLPGSIMGFDPSVYIEYVTDPDDPDYEIGLGHTVTGDSNVRWQRSWTKRQCIPYVPALMSSHILCRQAAETEWCAIRFHIRTFIRGKILEHLTSLRLLPSVRSGISMSRFTADIPDANMDWA